MKLSWYALATTALLVAPAWAATNPPPSVSPKVAIGDQSVSVRGITPGGDVVWFSLGRTVDEDEVPVVRRVVERSTDDDQDGVVDLQLAEPVAARSAWLAVDLTSGLYDLAAPAGFDLRVASWRGRGPLLGRGASDQLEDTRPFAEVLLVRPGAGAWTLRLGDGGAGDDDGKPDGTLHAAVDRMQPIDGSVAAPSRLQKGDVVALFDPNSLEVIVSRIATPNP